MPPPAVRIMSCSNCEEKDLKVRTSRVVYFDHNEYHLVCGKCGHKEKTIVKMTWDIIDELLPVEDIPKYFSRAEVLENLAFNKELFVARMKSKDNWIQRCLDRVEELKKEKEHLQQQYDLMLAIAFDNFPNDEKTEF